jgi:transcriptional regulator with XRE-family HTH domain
MKKQKSLRQLARELEISPAYLSMILSGQRKCPPKLRGTLYSFTNVHKTNSNGARKAGTLPTELLPLVVSFLALNPLPIKDWCLLFSKTQLPHFR